MWAVLFDGMCLAGDLQIDNLNMVVSAHKESLANLQAAKLAQDKEIQELQGMVCRNFFLIAQV